MRLLCKRHFLWLGSPALILTLGFVFGARTQASHFDFRYPARGGFDAIAQGGAATYYIDPAIPETPDNLHKTAIRAVHGRWNQTRNGGYNSYASETTTKVNWQQIQWRRISDPVFGTYMYYGPSASNCNFGNQAPWCRTEIIGQFTPPPHEGALAHELGHAIFDLADHSFIYDCSTLMSTCWTDLNGPTSNDARSARRQYGIPDGATFFPNWGGGSTDYICWYDNSVAESYHRVWLWKQNAGGGWDAMHSHDVAAQAGDQNWMCFGEDIYSELGTGNYLYGVWTYNQFSNGISGEQFGGFSNSGSQ